MNGLRLCIYKLLVKLSRHSFFHCFVNLFCELNVVSLLVNFHFKLVVGGEPNQNLQTPTISDAYPYNFSVYFGLLSS